MHEVMQRLISLGGFWRRFYLLCFWSHWGLFQGTRAQQGLEVSTIALIISTRWA